MSNTHPAAYLVLMKASPPLIPVAGNIVLPSIGQTWQLRPGDNILGRDADPTVTVVLPWHQVSRRHACIEWLGAGACVITDLQSRNHTKVNGQILPAGTATPLNDGARILIANDIELMFCLQLDPGMPRPTTVMPAQQPGTNR